jgi:hypothetical protein
MEAVQVYCAIQLSGCLSPICILEIISCISLVKLEVHDGNDRCDPKEAK